MYIYIYIKNICIGLFSSFFFCLFILSRRSTQYVMLFWRDWEMQLKGGGTTPFCRGADGRAV